MPRINLFRICSIKWCLIWVILLSIRKKHYRKQLVSCPFSWGGSPRVHFQVQDRLLSFYRECDEPKNKNLQCSIAKYHPHFINQEFRKTLKSVSSTKSVSQHQIWRKQVSGLKYLDFQFTVVSLVPEHLGVVVPHDGHDVSHDSQT